MTLINVQTKNFVNYKIENTSDALYFIVMQSAS